MLGEKTLFVSLGRTNYGQMLDSFLFHLGEKYKGSEITLFTDHQDVYRSNGKTYTRWLYERGVASSSAHLADMKPVMDRMNEVLDKVESENFDRVYFLDTMVGAEWLTVSIEPSKIKTISLAGYAELSQKYFYLSRLFDCMPDLGKISKVARDRKEFFEFSKLGAKTLYMGDPGDEQAMFSPNQFLVIPHKKTVDLQVLERYLANWEISDQESFQFQPVLEGCSQYKVTSDGYTFNVISCEDIYSEFMVMSTIVSSFFSGAEFVSSDLYLVSAAIRRLRFVVQQVDLSIANNLRIFSNLENSLYDLEMAHKIYELIQSRPEGLVSLMSVSEELVKFDTYLIGLEEYYQNLSDAFSTKGKE